MNGTWEVIVSLSENPLQLVVENRWLRICTYGVPYEGFTVYCSSKRMKF